MKVCQLLSVHRGGDVRVTKWAEALEMASHQVITLAYERPGESSEVALDPRIQSLGAFKPNRLWRLFDQPRILWRAHCQRADVIQLHDPELLPLLFVYSVLVGKRVIFDMHEDFRASLVDRGAGQLVGNIYQFVLLCWDRWQFLTLAEECYRGLVKHPWPVIHNYPNVEFKPGQYEKVRQFVYLGDVAIKRGAINMIRAFGAANLPSWRLVVIGPCNEDGTEAAMEAEIRRLGLQDAVVRKHYTPKDAAIALLRRSSIGLATLYPERNYLRCPPGKVWEYLLCGLPTIVSDFPAYRMAFGACGAVTFVDPQDTEAIASAMRTVSGRTEALRELAKEWKGTLEDRCTWKAEAPLAVSVIEMATKPQRRSVCRRNVVDLGVTQKLVIADQAE
jgi:glycosyltransferase involved in cell wall biosynthesis